MASAAHKLTCYLDVGGEGDSYPEWLAILKNVRGCYVIRDRATKRVLYVGSSKHALYATVTRHFQQWRRNKKWWSGGYGAGHDPGMTYQRGRCDVAVLAMEPGGDYLGHEAKLIAKLKPRDNLIERPDGGEGEAAPF